MKITIMGHKYDYPYIFVNEVQMPATFIARPAKPPGEPPVLSLVVSTA